MTAASQPQGLDALQGHRHWRSFDNIAAAMQGIPESSARRQIALFAKCDPAYGEGVRKALRLERDGDDRLKGTSATDEIRPSEALPA